MIISINEQCMEPQSMIHNSEDIQFHTPAQAGTDPIKISQHKFYAMQFFPGF